MRKQETGETRDVGAAARSSAALRAVLWVACAMLPLMFASAAQAQGFSDVYIFNGEPDGANPTAGVIADSEGNLYGTTYNGGAFGYGAVYEILVSGYEMVLYSFTGGRDGAYPVGGLIRDAQGNLYGTTRFGGSTGSSCVNGSLGCGVVFVVSPEGKERILYGFTGGSDGSEPYSALIRDSAGNLYGTTLIGGLSGGCQGTGCGVVFKLARAGEETVLYTFGGSPDGALPVAGLVRDSAGNLYGTTQQGGNPGCYFGTCGVVFEVDSSGNETLLYSFTGGSDGGNPDFGALILDQVGNLYGTTEVGGNDTSCGVTFGCGVAFQVTPTRAEIRLYAFNDGADGGFPLGGLVRDARGNLYGTASEGGDSCCNYGVVFKLSASGEETVLHSFEGTDGWEPEATLLVYKGRLYGTTAAGGPATAFGGVGYGVVFWATPGP